MVLCTFTFLTILQVICGNLLFRLQHLEHNPAYDSENVEPLKIYLKKQFELTRLFIAQDHCYSQRTEVLLNLVFHNFMHRFVYLVS